MGMRLARSALGKLWRGARAALWCLLGLWAALALFFTAPVPGWAAVVLAAGAALLYAGALRERFYVPGRPGTPWREARRSLAALAVTAAVAAWYFGFMAPDPNEDWIVKHARHPHVEIEGDKVRVSNVRNFTWRTETDFTPGYYDRVYDVKDLCSVYYALSPIFDLRWVAHVWVCFGFTDGQHVAVSVEARGVKERPFGLFRSMFRQFQLIYVVGDERDVIGLRGAIRGSEVRVYPARSTPERRRALFLDMLRRAHSLEEHPEYYNLFTNNCMNNVTRHVRDVADRPVPSDLRLLLTGLSDRAWYEYGFLDTDLPFEKAHEAYRVDEWVRRARLDEGFSRRLREALRRQGADKAPYP
jgi:hypothetical protein